MVSHAPLGSILQGWGVCADNSGGPWQGGAGSNRPWALSGGWHRRAGIHPLSLPAQTMALLPYCHLSRSGAPLPCALARVLHSGRRQRESPWGRKGPSVLGIWPDFRGSCPPTPHTHSLSSSHRQVFSGWSRSLRSGHAARPGWQMASGRLCTSWAGSAASHPGRAGIGGGHRGAGTQAPF